MVRRCHPWSPSTATAPTTDAQSYLDGGALLPTGGHRGSGIALMWEVLTGVLPGGRILSEMMAPSAPDQRTGNSLFLMAIDPDAVLPDGEFADRVDRLIARSTPRGPHRASSA